MHNRTNVSMLAVAITAALGFSATASAEVAVYGQIHTSVARISQDTCSDTVTTNCDYSATAIASHASRLGVKANKPMDNGLEAIGVAEFEYDTVDGVYSSSKSKDYPLDLDGDGVVDTTVTDTNSDKQIFKPRNMYVGLKGGFGEARIGHMDTPHKLATANLDPFGDTYADYNNIITVDNRLGNVVAYINKFGPVGVAAAYHAGDDSVTGENNKSATSIMVNYDANGLYLAGAVESYGDTVAATNDLKSASVVGAGYGFGPVKLGLAYERLAFDGTSKDDESEIYASLQWKVTDSGTVKAAYGKRDDGVDATDDAVMAALGYDHKMDKAMSVYALYANGTDGGLANKGKLKGDGSALALGVSYKF
ncbi:MAG TPA: porin [Gammaproteobacteria bacterium]